MMLQPIKNFITYLQKSANSTTIFGLTSNMSESAGVVDSSTSLPVDSSDGSHNKTNVTENPVPSSPIKSHDQNENEVIIITDESENNSSSRKTAEDGNDEIHKENTEQADTTVETIECLSDGDAEVSNGDFAVNEIILDEDDIHNTSLTDPGTDPLAIEDYQADVSNNNLLLGNSGPSTEFDTSTQDTQDTESILIIDVDDIKESENLTDENNSKNEDNSVNSDADKDEHREELFEAPRLPLEDISEEQEIRSDGSDSGLGSETSALQTTATSVDTSVSIDSPIGKLGPNRSNLKRRSNEVLSVTQKKLKRTIHFDGVKVYYFPRMQGFACVPSQGGCTLGMGARHTHCRNFTLAEHAAEQRRVHKQQMQEINPRGSSSEETDSDEELSEASGSDLDADANGFLQPVPAKQRRAILKAAGIRKIDSAEKDECRAIRSSREFCGCSCRGYCDPEMCSCSQAGIKCQVDRPSFPCGCTRDGCANVVGRIEFNPNRVRTHFIHTIMRLELENKEKTSPELHAAPKSLLTYGSNCASNNSNISATASNNCSNNINNLSNLCNYNLSNMNHIRPQHYGHLQMAQHNSGYMGNPHGHNNMYPSMLPNGVLSETCALPHMTQHHQQMVSNGCVNMMNASTSNVGQPHQQMDMSFNAFRDISTDGSLCASRSDNTSGGMILDYQSESSQVYHGTYTSQSYLNHSYHNNYHAPVPTYSNYQQHYVAYASSSCNNEGMEIHDLTTDDESSSYISLHPPAGNSPRLDAINDLLQSNRNTLPASPSITTTSPITDPVPMKPVNVAPTISCTLAPSAQTSTSITDGTSTTISPIKNKTVSQLSAPSDVKHYVDLTNDGIKSNNTYTTTPETSLRKCTEGSQNMLTEREIKRRDSDVEIIEPVKNLSHIELNESKEKESDTSAKENIPAKQYKLETLDSDKGLSKVTEDSNSCGDDREVTSQLSDDKFFSTTSRSAVESEIFFKEALERLNNIKPCQEDNLDNSVDEEVLNNQKEYKPLKESNDVELVEISVNTALTNNTDDVVESVQTTAYPDIKDSTVETSTTTASPPSMSISSKTTIGKTPHESDENLTEIIKKSIVETVSA